MGLVAFKELGRVTPVAATAVGSADTLVTNDADYDTIVKRIIIHNVHTAEVTAYLCVVPDNAAQVATATDDERFFAIPIDAGGTAILNSDDLSIPLNDTNDTVQIYASVTNKLNAVAFGYVFDDQE
jgi:hypothetical protein